MNTPEKRDAVLLAIKRHRFSHGEFSLLLAAVASKAADMVGEYEGMDGVSQSLDEAADGMEAVFVRDPAKRAPALREVRSEIAS